MGEGSATQRVLSEEDRSKDAFFAQIGGVADKMIEKHGKDFAMGVLILCARFIAEGKPLRMPKGEMRE